MYSIMKCIIKWNYEHVLSELVLPPFRSRIYKFMCLHFWIVLCIRHSKYWCGAGVGEVQDDTVTSTSAFLLTVEKICTFTLLIFYYYSSYGIFVFSMSSRTENGNKIMISNNLRLFVLCTVCVHVVVLWETNDITLIS